MREAGRYKTGFYVLLTPDVCDKREMNHLRLVEASRYQLATLIRLVVKREGVVQKLVIQASVVIIRIKCEVMLTCHHMN